jgi:C1A family cysteine protease
MQRVYKLKPDSVDLRDHLHFIHPEANIQLPSLLDLRAKCPPIFDQGNIGSCTANAGIAYLEIIMGNKVNLSRLFLYYNERVIENTVSSDAGASMRDICKALQNYGACREQFDPYVPSMFARKPSTIAYTDARNYRIKSYQSVPNLEAVKKDLFVTNMPVLMAMKVYTSFESQEVASSGIVPMPQPNEQLLGGHAVLIVGYDETKQWLIVRNSWGSGWGDKGYFYLPYSYVTSGNAFDFWTMM